MRRLINKNSLRLCIALLAGATLSHAAVLYSAPPNQSGGSDLTSYLAADNATFAGVATLTQIKFWSLQSSVADYTGSIAWSINPDAASAPGAVLFSGSATPTGVATGNSGLGLNEFSYAFPINVVVLPGTYWVVLHNGPTGSFDPNLTFYWGWSSDSGNSVSQDLSIPPAWFGNSAELAMELQGSETPEPASFLLLGAGLLALGFVRSRKNS